MPRKLLKRRSSKEQIRRVQRRQPWYTLALCAGRKCRTPRLLSSILRANTPNPPCPLSWLMFRHRKRLACHRT